MKFYLLHPIAVHFPIALLLTALGIETFSLFSKEEKWNWLLPSAEWLLYIGMLSLWLAVGLGLLAEETAPHIPSAWEVLEEHKTLGFWSAGLFSALSLARFYFKKKWRNLEIKWRGLFVLFWTVSGVVLISTAFHGGELVFNFGMGVQSH